jgi:membrane associated rhomboid family serine protease
LKNVARGNALNIFYIVLLLIYRAVDLALAALVPEDAVAACAVIDGLYTSIILIFHLFHH